MSFALLLVTTALTPADAAIVTLPFAGRLTSAVNNVFDDPDIPQGNFFAVGQAFSGTFSYDDADPGDFDGSIFISYALTRFDLVIGGEDFSDRFIPRLVGRSTDGTVDIVSGGADQGGGARLSVDLGSFAPANPSAGQLIGRTASFTYDDFYPLGGQLAGVATIGSVPEPATWAMMIGGFALTGAAMRRRRSVAAKVSVRFG
ncbi:PEPxxWA-CTERM sorting domain-containing protein [Sphingomonas profundi]|uniref:PEPxxWA-CTERM sorting domain-containing protein n=1 Tax=Alterirhizorhabdus profundi TaxID=2681549 RepID=UPI001E65B62C|nr:PEPxxWA-CTERM sorting domain-containing protein [Sphingomonas profundi]